MKRQWMLVALFLASPILSRAACVILPTVYHLVPIASAATPAGLLMQTGAGAGSGFTPTYLIDNIQTQQYWYTTPITGNYVAGSYAVGLITNPGGGIAMVKVELALCNADGSSPTILGSDTQNVWVKSGNHSTAFVFAGVPALTLTNQVFRIQVTKVSGPTATMVANGNDFDSQLQTTEGNNGGCVCGFTQVNYYNGPTDKVIHITTLAGAEPAGWDTNPLFDDSAWTNAITWVTGGFVTINAAYPWSAWNAAASSNGSDKECVRVFFNIPAGATGITGTFYIKVDDNSVTKLNGTTIQTDLQSLIIANQITRSFPITANLVVGSNFLSIRNSSPNITQMGYNYKIALQYTGSCGTPTNTPAVTPTSTNTPTLVATATTVPTPGATATPAPTAPPAPTPPPSLVLHLARANPNPATGLQVWLPYLVSVPADVDITIYTVAGEIVRKLDSLPSPAGYSERVWDLKNSASQAVGSGVFIYRVKAVSGKGETVEDSAKLSVLR